MMTKEIAKADLSLARCWRASHSLVLLDGMADENQQALWFNGVVERGDKWVPGRRAASAQAGRRQFGFGTTVDKSMAVT